MSHRRSVPPPSAHRHRRSTAGLAAARARAFRRWLRPSSRRCSAACRCSSCRPCRRSCPLVPVGPLGRAAPSVAPSVGASSSGGVYVPGAARTGITCDTVRVIAARPAARPGTRSVERHLDRPRRAERGHAVRPGDRSRPTCRPTPLPSEYSNTRPSPLRRSVSPSSARRGPARSSSGRRRRSPTAAPGGTARRRPQPVDDLPQVARHLLAGSPIAPERVRRAPADEHSASSPRRSPRPGTARPRLRPRLGRVGRRGASGRSVAAGSVVGRGGGVGRRGRAGRRCRSSAVVAGRGRSAAAAPPPAACRVAAGLRRQRAERAGQVERHLVEHAAGQVCRPRPRRGSSCVCRSVMSMAKYSAAEQQHGDEAGEQDSSRVNPRAGGGGRATSITAMVLPFRWWSGRGRPGRLSVGRLLGLGRGPHLGRVEDHLREDDLERPARDVAGDADGDGVQVRRPAGSARPCTTTPASSPSNVPLAAAVERRPRPASTSAIFAWASRVPRRASGRPSPRSVPMSTSRPMATSDSTGWPARAAPRERQAGRGQRTPSGVRTRVDRCAASGRRLISRPLGVRERRGRRRSARGRWTRSGGPLSFVTCDDRPLSSRQVPSGRNVAIVTHPSGRPAGGVVRVGDHLGGRPSRTGTRRAAAEPARSSAATGRRTSGASGATADARAVLADRDAVRPPSSIARARASASPPRIASAAGPLPACRRAAPPKLGRMTAAEEQEQAPGRRAVRTA